MAHSLAQNTLHAVEAVGGISGIAALLTYWAKRREIRETAAKSMVDTAKSLTETSLLLLEPVRAGLVAAEGKVEVLKAQVKQLEGIVDALTESMRSAAAKSTAEREQLAQQLEAVTAEREKLAAELVERTAELEALRQQAPSAGAA